MSHSAERRFRYMLDHLLGWHNRPRAPGQSVTVPKVCEVYFTPYERQSINAVMMAIILRVLDTCIDIEEGKAVNDEAREMMMEHAEELLEIIAEHFANGGKGLPDFSVQIRKRSAA